MHPALSNALTERGYDTLTPVQEAVSDPALAEADLLVSAQTGSGKTVGFGLAIAPTLLGDAPEFGPAALPLALVVAPTRELAFQVMRELRWLYAQTGARVSSCVGGMDMRDERRALARGAHIVVGTPGRLRDHIERGSLDLSEIRAVVLDEADEMLDLGFREDLEFMLSAAPETRRTLLFSATVPPMIAKLAETYQQDAQRISTGTGAKQHADITYQAIRVAAPDTENAIFNLLRFHEAESAIVFANTRAAVGHLMARLSNRGFDVVALSGELTQTERSNALQAMRDGRAKICVATDVAARGIDLPKLDLVIHADLPTNTESLLHRSGRTGRAGRKGISALIVPPRAVKKTERLLRWAKIHADWIAAPTADEIRTRDEARLLDDPAWSDPASEEESAFAAKLLDAHGPEAIAAAYLRLYRSRRSAPEELLPPDVKSPRPEKEAFGPSKWLSLSVGRDGGAEPRWLLPLLCRGGGVEKSVFGAIRVQDAETFVEVKADALDALVASFGPDGTVEDGMTATVLETAPELPARSSRPPRDRPTPPRREKPARPPRREGERKGGPKGPRPPRPAADDAPRGKPTRKPRKDTSRREGSGDAPARKPHGKSKSQGTEQARSKPGKPSRTKDARRPNASDGPKSKPAGKPKRPSAASDSSKRFTPPGQKPRKPRKPAHPKGGEARPRRKA